MAKARPPALLCVGAALAGVVSGVRVSLADLAPPPSYVETCTLAKQQRPGERCEECSVARGDNDTCRFRYAEGPFAQRCARRDSPARRTEIWCAPARVEPVPPVPTPTQPSPLLDPPARDAGVVDPYAHPTTRTPEPATIGPAPGPVRQPVEPSAPVSASPRATGCAAAPAGKAAAPVSLAPGLVALLGWLALVRRLRRRKND